MMMVLYSKLWLFRKPFTSVSKQIAHHLNLNISSKSFFTCRVLKNPEIQTKEEGQPETNKNAIFNTDFCLEIAKQVGLQTTEKGSNFIISPMSIHAILNLIAAGSTGKTLEQLLLFLKYKTSNDLNEVSSRFFKLMSPHGDGGPVLSYATGVWVDRRFPLKPSFKEIICGAHGAEAKNVDFKAKADQLTKEVNSWVENATKGLVKGVLRHGDINNLDILILANTLYFKGVWDQVYVTFRTQDDTFYPLNGDELRVPFMFKLGRLNFFRSFDDFKVLKLPYKSGTGNRKFSMYFFLPEEKNGLKNLMEKLNYNAGFFNQYFELQKVELEACRIPKFKMSSGFEVLKILKEFKLEFPLMDLGELCEKVDSAQELHVSAIIHRSCIEVNEQGTEATAAFFKRRRRTCPCNPPPEPPKPTFVADHPFMFMIREETSRMVLFTGAVLNPSSEI